MKRYGKTIPVRIPLPKKTGGAHRDESRYDRKRDRKQVIRNWKRGEE